MAFIRRGTDVDPATFELEWCLEHARLVKRMPGIRGYRQNIVTQRQGAGGTPCSRDELPIDGVVEIWFDTREAFSAALASPEGTRAGAQGKTIFDVIATFQVETAAIVEERTD